MKELSIEEKAKRYDEALKYAKIYYTSGDEDMKMMMKTCFPALVDESEDEKIMKQIKMFIISHSRNESNNKIDSWLAWLEKQREHKPAEWSEEVEAAITLLKDIAEEQEKDYCPHNANDLRKAAQYLETCRPQTTWKPSESDIFFLERIANGKYNPQYFQASVGGLIGHLKKLREE
jgi:hypothetical protein